MNGIRIIDLTRVLAGPWATMMLADQGAEVIKVEPPGGDETRRYEPTVQGEATYFQSVNRNKRSIVLNLSTAGGQEVLHRLLGTADVVIENYRPGVASRLGLVWEEVHEAHPSLIYVAIHAFGDEVPGWRGRPGYDLVLQAMGGAVSFSGFPGEPPVRSGVPIADLMASQYATQAMLLALLQRHETGLGQKVVVNMMQSQASALTYHASRYAGTGEAETRRGNAHRGLVPYDVYQCEDGWLAIACGNDRMWTKLREALGLAHVPAWDTNKGRVASRDEVDAVIKAQLMSMRVEKADEVLAAAGVCAGPVLDVADVLAHPAVSCVRLEHPVLGTLDLPGPVLMTETTRETHSRAPDLDVDRDALFTELGFDTGEIAHLQRSGALGDVTPERS
jgi:crotonobetainyl-CoA:carnitine CoA-transferase CaiB-like acyl-CoA transferase